MQLIFFDRNSSIINDMRNSQSRVYIYGAGELGTDLKKFFLSLRIQVSGFVIDDEYYDDRINKVVDKGSNLINLSSFTKIQNDAQEYCFLIWGIANPSKIKSSLISNDIEKAYITYDLYQMWNDKEFAQKNKKEFDANRELLEDELSIKTFNAYLSIYDSKPQEDLDCIVDGTYFNELTRHNRKGCFVDCGAYIGDTAIAYSKIYGTDAKIYSFEPDKENYECLLNNTKNLNIVPVNAGCWHERTVLFFDNCGDASSSIKYGAENKINVVSVGEIVGEDRVAFVKMDVEGSELNALIGMEDIIKRDMPILAISAYHKQEDLIELPKFIKQFESESEYYKIYLRHHGCTVPELVLYGIPAQKK